MRARLVGPGGCDCVLLEEQALITDQHSGDTVCTTCACVVEAHCMDQGAEWYDDALSRAGGLGRFDEFLGPSGGAVVPAHKKRYAEPDQQKNVRQGLLEVERCAGLLGLGCDHQMCVTAKKIFSDYAELRKAQGRSVRESERTAAAACAVYFGCKSHERANDRHPRTIKEISGHCRVPLQECTDLLKNYKVLLADTPYARLLFMTVTAEDVLMRAVAGVRFEDVATKNQVLKRARDIFGVVRSKDLLEGRTPETVCSAVLFLACEKLSLKITKRMVYTACGVSNVTLNKALADLKAKV